jgi:hypothetical protein
MIGHQLNRDAAAGRGERVGMAKCNVEPSEHRQHQNNLLAG